MQKNYAQFVHQIVIISDCKQFGAFAELNQSLGS